MICRQSSSCPAGDGRYGTASAMKEDCNKTYEEQVSMDVFDDVSPIRPLNASTEKDRHNRGEINITHPKIRRIETIDQPIRVLRGREIHVSDTSEIISLSDSTDSEPRKTRRNICNSAKKKRKRLEQSTDESIIRERDELRSKLEEANLRIHELGGDGEEGHVSVGSASSRANYPTVEDVMETYKREPVHALEAELRHHIGMVEYVARRSSRLKGTMAKSLYMAVVHMQAGVSEYVRRVVSSPKHRKEADENKELKKQVENMKEEIAELRQMVADLKADNRRLRYTDDDTVDELQVQNEEKEKKIQDLLIERAENNKAYEELRKQIQEEEERKKSKNRRIRIYNSKEEYMCSDIEFPPLEQPKAIYNEEKKIEDIRKSSNKISKRIAKYSNKNENANDREDYVSYRARRQVEVEEDRVSNNNNIVYDNENTGRIHREREHDGNYGRNDNYNNYNKKNRNRQRNTSDRERMALGQRQDKKTYRQTYNYRQRYRPEVIALHCVNDNITYAQAVKKAKEGIDLKKIGIDNVNMRKARNGGIIMRINGPGNKEKADTLAKAMKEVLEKDCVRISRPVKLTDVRITGIDEDVSPDDIKAAIVNLDGGKSDNIKISNIRTTNDGQNVAWISCPAATADKVNREGIDIGWGRVKASKLLPKPVQCYRCLGFGHVRNACKSQIDRSTVCYKCGTDGHKAYECKNEINCIICKESGRKSSHRMGGGRCFSRLEYGGRNVLWNDERGTQRQNRR